MGIQRVKANTTANSTTLTATLPNPTTVGATEIALITTTSGSSGITMPAGWTQRATNTTQSANCFVYDRVVTTTSQQSLTLTLPSGGAVIYLIEATGLNGFDVSAASSGAGPSASLVSGTATPTTANSYLLSFVAHDTNATDAFGAPVTLVDQHTLTGSTTSFHSAYAEGSVTGTTGRTVTVTPSVSASGWETLLVVYKAAAADTTAPTVPGSVAATANSSTSVTVTWAASTDAVGVASYRLRRGGVNVTGATALTGLTFTETGLTPSTAYSYTVSAVDAAGNRSAESTAAPVTTLAPPDTTPPTVPTGATATANSPTQITVGWTASTDAVGVASYRVRRGGVDVTGATAVVGTSFVDTTASPATAYSYTISAIDAAGNRSAESTAALATTPTAGIAISDNFTAQDNAKWTYSPRASVAGGRLNLVRNADYGAMIRSKQTYSLTGSALKAEFVSVPGTTPTTYADTSLTLVSGASDENALSFDFESGVVAGVQLAAYIKTSGTWGPALGPVAYSPASHRWLQIREAGGTVFWETSADGSSWSTLYSTATPWPVTVMSVVLATGDGAGETVVVDNLNYTAIVSQGSATPSGSTSATGDGTNVHKIETLTENWQSGVDGAKWVAAQIDGVRASVSGGRLALTTGTAANSYKAVDSLSRYALAGSSVHASIDYDPVTHVASNEALLQLLGPGSGNRVEWLVHAGVMSARAWSNSVEDAAYSIAPSVRAMFYRISNTGGGPTGGTVSFETSMDAVVWTVRATKVVAWDLTSLLLSFAAGRGDDTSGDETVFFDNVNLAPQSLQGDASLSANSTTTSADGFLTITGPGSAAGVGANAEAVGDGTAFNPNAIVSYVNLTGRFLTDWGQPLEGTIILTPEVRYRVDAVNDRIVSIQARVVPLINGEFVTRIPANGPYWRWRCEVVPADSPVRQSFDIRVPIGAATVDIADCVGDAIPDPAPEEPTGLYPGLDLFPSPTLFPSA